MKKRDMKVYNVIWISISLIIGLQSCQSEAGYQASSESESTAVAVVENSNDFNRYWYQGQAEISSYKLEQSRYGEIHDGHAVLVYVTEDFSNSKQVKLDNAAAAGKDAVPILKLNFVKKFNTGIYPYSLMQSVFTPVDLNKHPQTLKTSMSMQEWCGHVFSQLNLNKKGYHLSAKSYFESEGDVEKQLDKAMLEDELWTRIRINPASLPTGKVTLLPGSFYSRLLHKELKPEEAMITKETKGEEVVYTIDYPSASRTLTIHFEDAFPHKILAWEETTKAVFGNQRLTTKATLMKDMMSAYWSKHNTEHLPLRTELNID